MAPIRTPGWFLRLNRGTIKKRYCQCTQVEPLDKGSHKKSAVFAVGGSIFIRPFWSVWVFFGAKVTSQGPSAWPAIKTPTIQRAWCFLQVHHKDGPVRDASSKGGVEGAYLVTRLPAARAPDWRASHNARQGAARSAPESPGEASASSTMSTSSSHRSEEPRLAHLLSTLGKEVRKSTC